MGRNDPLEIGLNLFILTLWLDSASCSPYSDPGCGCHWQEKQTRNHRSLPPGTRQVPKPFAPPGPRLPALHRHPALARPRTSAPACRIRVRTLGRHKTCDLNLTRPTRSIISRQALTARHSAPMLSACGFFSGDSTGRSGPRSSNSGPSVSASPRGNRQPTRMAGAVTSTQSG